MKKTVAQLSAIGSKLSAQQPRRGQETLTHTQTEIRCRTKTSSFSKQKKKEGREVEGKGIKGLQRNSFSDTRNWFGLERERERKEGIYIEIVQKEQVKRRERGEKESGVVRAGIDQP